MKEQVRLQDDLYEAINGEWIRNATIPSDRPCTGGFIDLDVEVEKTLMKDFKEFANGTKKVPLDEIKDAVELYKKVLDVKKRNEEGIKPVLPILKKIQEIDSIEKLNKYNDELLVEDYDLPINMGVEPDMKDATKNAFVVLGPSTILPDTTYYSDDNPAGKQLLDVWSKMASKALSFTPLSEEEQKEYLQDALAFDALVAKKVKSQVEWADYTKNYNPMPVSEVAKYVEPFDIKGLLDKLYKDKAPETLIVYDPKAIKEMKDYFSKDTFKLFIHWSYVNKLLRASNFLSEELSANATTYRRAMYGIEKDPVLEKQAYQKVSAIYSEPIGVYYGREYFGEEAKKDVVDLVKKIIETYKSRVRKSNVLEEQTKLKAIKKLDTIVIKMGYPDKVDEFYSSLKVDPNESYYESMCKIGLLRAKHGLEKLNKPVDRNEWVMPGHMVNACYNPSFNDITFPAAILQAPFYSLKQTVSQNLGGIGAVIGHEISHAFDNNGAQFDENGNLNNWWSEKDYATFKKLTKQMIDEFDGIEIYGGKVNGELVVSENIADNGGMAVTLEIMHHTKGASFKEYFENWAKIWCLKGKDEYYLYLLNNDVHSPTKLRANLQVQNFDEWYETYNVTEKDKMYLPKEKRVVIW